MAWYAYIRDADGALLSLGTVDTPAPAGVTRTELAIIPTDPAWMYDASTRTFIARPVKVLIDRLQDMLTDPAYAEFVTAYNTLNTANRTRIRNGLIRLLGAQRFRAQAEPVEVG